MKPRVLVVDDDPLVADTLTWIFQANGYESEARYTAAEGLARARTFLPRLVLCDVVLPGDCGLQLAETIDREIPDCRVLMLTAYSSNADRVAWQSQRMRRPLTMLRKPCRPEELLEEATRMLEMA